METGSMDVGGKARAPFPIPSRSCRPLMKNVNSVKHWWWTSTSTKSANEGDRYRHPGCSLSAMLLLSWTEEDEAGMTPRCVMTFSMRGCFDQEIPIDCTSLVCRNNAGCSRMETGFSERFRILTLTRLLTACKRSQCCSSANYSGDTQHPVD